MSSTEIPSSSTVSRMRGGYTTQLDKERVARQRAERGARWLDENFPRWERRVDVTTLRLENGAQCICGQVFKQDAAIRRSLDGFAYAERHLFADANSWITGIVRIRAVRSAVTPLTEDEIETRRERVSIALGFQAGFVGNSSSFSRSDQTDIHFTELQQAWVALLTERKEARNGAH